MSCSAQCTQFSSATKWQTAVTAQFKVSRLLLFALTRRSFQRYIPLTDYLSHLPAEIRPDNDRPCDMCSPSVEPGLPFVNKTPCALPTACVTAKCTIIQLNTGICRVVVCTVRIENRNL